MKRTILAAALICWAAGSLAQDQLYKTDNTRILVKVLEVGPSDIKYKMFDNVSGPTYVENKKNVSLIIYQNGEHQVIANDMPSAPVQATVPASAPLPVLSRADSLTYFRYPNSISINFLNFFNNEVGLLYRREFFNSNFNIVIPVSFGVTKPAVTQNVYFGRFNNGIELGNKVVDGGFGIHYYPSLRTNTNYYIGPMVRYIQYNCTQREPGWVYPVNSNNTTLTRWAFTITNGFIYRTRSRLTTGLFASVGFKSDEISDPLYDQYGQAVNTIHNPFTFFWWSGFEVGFNF